MKFTNQQLAALVALVVIASIVVIAANKLPKKSTRFVLDLTGYCDGAKGEPARLSVSLLGSPALHDDRQLEIKDVCANLKSDMVAYFNSKSV